MVQEIIQNMPEADGMQTEPTPAWTTHMRHPPFSQFLNAPEDTGGNSTAPAAAPPVTARHSPSPVPSGSRLTLDHSPLPPHPHELQVEPDVQTIDDMETTCIDYSPKQS